MDTALDHAGDERFFGLRDSGIAKGSDDTLPRQTIAITIGMNELNEPRALDRFCSKKHVINRIAKKKSPVKHKMQKIGTTNES